MTLPLPDNPDFRPVRLSLERPGSPALERLRSRCQSIARERPDAATGLMGPRRPPRRPPRRVYAIR
jgi:hypothetical protein